MTDPHAMYGDGTFDDVSDEDSYWRARAAVRREPYGRARSARSEALLAAVERSGSTSLIADALVETVVSYNYGGESPKSTVSMARLLRLFDEQPGEFDESLTHRVYWHLKWVTSALLAVPEVPVATIRAYLDDMERRFRTAGHSLRPVHKCRFYLYDHTGDHEAAEREFAAWLAADRDFLTDCDACERREQGRWYAEHRKDNDAIEVFEPTLSGMRTCAEEPQLTIADSMLPLARLGRLDEARANHLRGYRLVRGSASTCASVGQHLEFCALTGNEARGVEVLAEHRGWLASPVDDATTRLQFFGGVAVLLRRLVVLGHGATKVADVPGTDGTAAGVLAMAEQEAYALAGRFDARNGSDFVSAQLGKRLGQQPVVESLPLGIRAVLAPVGRGAAPAAVEGGGSPDELLERARALWSGGHPGAYAAWEEYAAAASSQGRALGDDVAAELARVRGSLRRVDGRFAEAVEQYRVAAELFDRVGRVGAAHTARAHALTVVVHPAAPADLDVSWASDIDTLTSEIDDLLARGDARTTELGAVLVARLTMARIAQFTAGADDDQVAARERVVAETDRLARAAVEYDWPHRLATVAEARARVALAEGEHAAGVELLRTAVAEAYRAQRPWQAVGMGLLLGEVLLGHGDPAGAEEVLQGLYEDARGPLEDPAHFGTLLVHLTNASAANGRLDAAVEYALQAAHEHDRLGDRPGAATCRLGLASLLRELGRSADAVAVLEESLAEIGDVLGADAALRARSLLGSALSEIGQVGEAAELLAAVAAEAAAGDNPGLQATSAGDAAQALTLAGRRREADLAYAEALRLLGALDRPGAVVRLTRAAAWNVLDSRYDGSDVAPPESALAKFGEVVAALEVAVDGPDLNVAHERAVTEVQWAEALWSTDHDDEALELADRAAARLVAGLPAHQEQYAQLVGVAARVEEYVHEDAGAALSRLDRALEVARERDASEAVAVLVELRESTG